MLLPLLAQAQPQAFSGGVAGLVAHSGWMARSVLLLLLVFSLVSWAIIFYKGAALHRARSQSATFLDIFRKGAKFSEVNAVCPQLKGFEDTDMMSRHSPAWLRPVTTLTIMNSASSIRASTITC